MVTATASAALHLGCAAVCLVCAALVLFAGRGRDAWLTAGICLVSFGWATTVALRPEEAVSGLAGLIEVFRASLGAALLITLGRNLNGDGARPLMRHLTAGAILISVVALVMALPGLADGINTSTFGLPALLGRLGLALVVILVAENVWRNADEAARWHVTLPCIALGSLAAFDLLLYAEAALSNAFSQALLDARAALLAIAMPLLIAAAARNRRWRGSPRISRAAAFHGATFVVAGGFLLCIGALGEGLRRTGYDWGPAVQAALIAGALMGLAVALTSRSARSWLRRLLVDHFFQARYDYRREWMRCAATLAAPADDMPAQVRALRAIADAVDSPAAVLLLLDPGSPPEARAMERMRWAESWNMPARPVDLPPEHPALRVLAGGAPVLATEDAAFAELRATYGDLWLAVPLVHHRDGLLGAALLAHPRAPFPVDAEVAELLGTIGREVAMFLSERRAAERLADGRRLADYAKRFAFVAHDVKTVSSQLSLLLANAEDHIENPEFRKDMLLTVRAAVSRIDTLIARLRQDDAKTEGEQGSAPATAARPAPASASPQTSDVLARLGIIAQRTGHPVRVEAQASRPALRASIPDERFDEAVTHLLDNAVEASPPGSAVIISAARSGDRVTVEITDRGPGMTAEFVRDELFRPLRTTKARGNGIGAWQAREALRAAGGDLHVLSRPGEGTTMRLILPAAADTLEVAA